MKFKAKNVWSLIAALLILALATSACGPTSSSSDITFIIGNGTYDQKIHDIVYPNQSQPTDMSDMTTRVAPGNYRNYVIDDGTRLNDEDKPVSDSQKPLTAVLPSNTRIQVELTALWMLNQSAYKDENGIYKGPLAEFYKFADKYNALNTTNDKDGNVRNSTPGWNSMLAENFYPALSHALDQAIYNITNNYNSVDPATPITFPLKITDDIYKSTGKRQRDALAAEISRIFNSEIAKMTGVSGEPMFCGSGTQSGWVNLDPDKAGEPGNIFNCADVRIQIDKVKPVFEQTDLGSQSQLDANQQRYDAAKKLYGDQTECWLGIIDAIKACGETPNCAVVLESNQCQNPDGSDAGGTIIQFPNPLPRLPEAGAGTSVSPEATPAP